MKQAENPLAPPSAPQSGASASQLAPPWSPFSAFVLVIAAYLGASVAAELLMGFYTSLRHWDTARANNWLTNSTYGQFWTSVTVYGLMLLTVYLFSKKYHVSFKSFGWVRPRLRDLGITLIGAPVYIAMYVALEVIAKALFPGLDVNQSQQLGFQVSTDVLPRIVIFISLVVVPPIVEELLMRGFLFTSLLKRLSFLPAAVITSLVFAAAHLQIGSGAPPLWIASIDTFALSLVLCYMRYKTRSLWPGIFLHALKNGVAFLLIFVFHAG